MQLATLLVMKLYNAVNILTCDKLYKTHQKEQENTVIHLISLILPYASFRCISISVL